MRYPLEKLFGCCFFFFCYDLIRHLNIWKKTEKMDLRKKTEKIKIKKRVKKTKKTANKSHNRVPPNNSSELNYV